MASSARPSFRSADAAAAGGRGAEVASVVCDGMEEALRGCKWRVLLALLMYLILGFFSVVVGHLRAQPWSSNKLYVPAHDGPIEESTFLPTKHPRNTAVYMPK